jgi:hypothetical protein
MSTEGDAWLDELKNPLAKILPPVVAVPVIVYSTAESADAGVHAAVVTVAPLITCQF